MTTQERNQIASILRRDAVRNLFGVFRRQGESAAVALESARGTIARMATEMPMCSEVEVSQFALMINA